jgi:endonuclease/exonuclease/phosphatase family metal-dependent hydrolase
VTNDKALFALLGALILTGACQTRSGTDELEASVPDPVALAAISADSNAAAAEADLEMASHRAARRHARPLSVLTFNMEHKDKPKQLDVMAEHLRADLVRLPDFILLQEVVFKRAFWKGQDNTGEVLADELGYHCRGTKRTSDREGVAIASRYPFAHYDELHLKAQTSRFLLGFNRVSVMGEFMVPQVGRVRVVNVHFTNWNFEARVRRKQLKETLEWIDHRQARVHADLTILGGDFNFEPDWEEMELISDAADDFDVEFVNYNTDHPTHGPRGNPRHRVDYIFVSAPARLITMLGERRLFTDGLQSKSGDSFHLSDHVPVLHEYAITTPTGTTIAQGN